jgi:hypothetical protein
LFCCLPIIFDICPSSCKNSPATGLGHLLGGRGQEKSTLGLVKTLVIIEESAQPRYV